MSSSTTSTTPFDDLSDDVMGSILLYCDFVSAVQFCRETSKVLRERLDTTEASTKLQHVWRAIFERHGFSPIENDNNNENDYLEATRHRRQLLLNLLQQSKKKKRGGRRRKPQQCFNLPNKFFHFRPIVPRDILMDDEYDDQALLEDPPPVFYECDSFVLTSSGTNSELVLLDPFDGSLTIVADCLSHCVASDDDMMGQSMVHAAGAIQREARNIEYKDWKDEQIAGAAIEDSVLQNHSRHEQPQHTSTSQSLLGPDDYFSFDICPYFPGRQRQESMELTEEFEMAYVGTEAKSILDPDSNDNLKGFMVGVGRSVRNLQEEDVVCTELTTWTRSIEESQYGNRRVCRLPWTFDSIDMDATHERLYVSFHDGDGPFGIPQPQRSGIRQSQVVAYPMIPWEGEDASDGDDGGMPRTNYFPDPLFSVQCQHPVSSFAVDATGGTLIVATTGGTLELWHVQSSVQRYCFQILNLEASLRTSIEGVWTRQKSSKRTSRLTDGVQSSTESFGCSPTCVGDFLIPPLEASEEEPDNEEDVGLAVLRRQPDLAHLQAPVQSFYLPKHLPIEKSGFVTLQHHREEGNCLLLWRANNNSPKQFEIVSLINLPLSSRRVPRVSYDGSRLIVFGEDHIGTIILIYHVVCDDYMGSLHREPQESSSSCGEASGGVYNFTSGRPRVRFANRIRHVALGGIDPSFDSIHMTCNERLIVVNTRTGNLLGGASPFSEGLLVIDLQDKF